jgi:peptidoglycan/xylan/chitin deacetylase (PgdA/CDA1 family)
MLLAVNFHYIQPEDRFPFPGIYPTTAQQLDHQLVEIGRSFEYINSDDLVNAVASRKSLPERACLITFDDGLKEQYQAAVPVLEKRGIQGVFFICTQPLIDAEALTVHKMHRLRVTRPPGVFLEQALEVGNKIGLRLDLEQVDDHAANQQYLYDDQSTKRIKYLLNHVIPFDGYERLIQAMFSSEFDENEFCHEMYMNEDELKTLSTSHTVGSHAHAHCPLAILSRKELRNNLRRSRTTLERITGKAINLISYPYGGITAVTEMVGHVAKETGFVAGFTMERSVNRSLQQPQLLARVSTNDAPGGKSPLLSISENGKDLAFLEPMTGFRTWYMDEVALVSDQGVLG